MRIYRFLPMLVLAVMVVLLVAACGKKGGGY
jgi:predicted small lipoprotein YifL